MQRFHEDAPSGKPYFLEASELEFFCVEEVEQRQRLPWSFNGLSASPTCLPSRPPAFVGLSQASRCLLVPHLPLSRISLFFY